MWKEKVMATRFLVKLKDAHVKSGLTPYAVAKQTGLNYNTVNKYVSAYVEADVLHAHVIQLAEFYGLDWHDPAVIEAIEVNEDKSSGQQKTLLAVPA
jgi:hypothetical protein